MKLDARQTIRYPVPKTSQTRAKSIHKRLFLVGCSRSGTTLLQVLMARHPRIYSLPETFFFVRTTNWKSKRLYWLGLATGKEQPFLEKFLHEVGRDDLSPLLPQAPRFFNAGVKSFLTILDRMALDHHRDVWLEKTPNHIFYLDLIQKYVPNCHIIHLIRDGRDVVASIRDRALKFPDKFPHQLDPSFGIERWNQALEVSAKYLGKPGHTHVSYEQLTQDPDLVLAQICHDNGIEYDPGMKKNCQDAITERVIGNKRQWLTGSKGFIRPAASKFSELFTSEQQAQISAQLNLAEFERLKENILIDNTSH